MGKVRLSSFERLDEINLDDDIRAQRSRRQSTRPDSLSGPVHEMLFVLLSAFIGASFLLLQRATMVITDTVRHSLLLDMSDVVWMSASPGLTGAVFLLPIAHIADRCPNISRKSILVVSIMLFSLTLGLATLTRNGIVLDVLLGVAGLASAVHLPIMSSLLTSIYVFPSTRRHCVLAFFLAGGNAFSIIFGGVGAGLVDKMVEGDWRGSFLYIAILYAIVAVVGALVIPNMPRTHNLHAITSRAQDRYTLLGHPVAKRSAWTD